MTELATRDNLADEPDLSPGDERWLSLLDRLNDLSVHKHFDAYGDIAWDDPEYHLDPTDARWELDPELDPLGATDWYKSLPADKRARLGCELVASKMKLGLIFENILKQGLLRFAMTLPNGAPEFRYAYHEVIEEAQHSLMFQEFVNRTGYDAPGLSRIDGPANAWIIGLGKRFPQLFFLFVLGGEDPIDYVQRRELRSDRPIHPLLERIMRIHVTDKRGTCPSLATTSSAPCPRSAAPARHSWPSSRRSSSVRWPSSCSSRRGGWCSAMTSRSTSSTRPTPTTRGTTPRPSRR